MPRNPKTNWTGREGTLTFFLPDSSQHEFPAYDVDHPDTMCKLVDSVLKLSSKERRMIITMVAGQELSSHKEKKQ